jgi:hypothetical protein
MSISVNKINDFITGNIGNEQFGIHYNEKVYNEMLLLEARANEAKTFEELTSIIDEFKPLTVEDISATIESINPNIHVSRKTGEYFLKNNGVVSSIAMPKELVDRIKESMDKNIDFTPLIKAWTRWLRNPKLRKLNKQGQIDFSKRFFNFINIKVVNSELVDKLVSEKGYSKEVATSIATTYSMKISNEGILVGFKVSEEITKKYILDEEGNAKQVDLYPTTKTIDPISGLITESEPNKGNNENRFFRPAVMKDSGDAFLCSASNTLGHIIKVGASHSITWDQINCDDNRSCCSGLHIGGIDYIRGYQNSNTSTHNVFVCPSKIGAIPDDSTGAIRCIEYFVKDEFTGVNGSIYHSSTYGSKLDSDWNNEREEIIKAFGVLQEENAKMISQESSELKSL